MPGSITKMIRQYSRVMTAEDMEKLWDIAKDYAVVKNYIYNRYSGIKSLSKLYPGYTVQNEMTNSGFRQSLGLPSIYFYLAIFDALGDIKANWKIIRKKIAKNASRNQNFSELEKHYVRYALKSDFHFNQVILRQAFSLPEPFSNLETARLNNYICRQVRKYLFCPKVKKQNIFQVSPKGYAYEPGGIKLTTKIPRKRLFVPLTDKNQYDRQIVVELKENRLVLYVPIESRIHRHKDYINEIGLSFGYYTMLTSSTGNAYGQRVGEMQGAETERLIDVNKKRQALLAIYKKHLAKGNIKKAKKIEVNNLGRQKYDAQKGKAIQRIQAYINAEINRMLKEEKPAVIYIPKLPSFHKGYSKTFNAKLSAWRRGYIKERLIYKCAIHGVQWKEVNAADIGKKCGQCGESGVVTGEMFVCSVCGFTQNSKQNAAKIILKRGRQIKI